MKVCLLHGLEGPTESWTGTCVRSEESLVSRAVESEVFATMTSRSGRQEETGDRSRESRREADGHIDDFVSSPVGRRSPTTAAGPSERHRIASASPTPARRQQGGATAPFPGTGRGPPARGKGSSPGEIGVGFTTAQLEQLGAAIQCRCPVDGHFDERSHCLEGTSGLFECQGGHRDLASRTPSDH